MEYTKVPVIVVETIKIGISDNLIRISKNHTKVKQLVVALRGEVNEVKVLEHQVLIAKLKASSLTCSLKVVKLTDTLNSIRSREMFSGEVKEGVGNE